MKAVSRVYTLCFLVYIFYQLCLITAVEHRNDLRKGAPLLRSHNSLRTVRRKRDDEDRSASPSEESEEERYGFNPFVQRNNWLNPYEQQSNGLQVGGAKAIPYTEFIRGEDVGLRVSCARLGEMYYYNSPVYQCMICVCQSFAMTLSPICVSCQSCSAATQQHNYVQPTLILPTEYPTHPPYPTNVVPIDPYNHQTTPAPSFPPDVLPFQPTEQTGQQSCDPLPTNEQFQHPLNPCQICICRKEITMYGVPDVKISCVNNPQCVVREQDRWKIPEDTTVPLPHCVNFPQQTTFPHPDDSCKECQCIAVSGVQTILCKKKPGCDDHQKPPPNPDNQVVWPVTPKPHQYIPDNNPIFPVDPYKPTPVPNTVWPNKHNKSPLPGPSPHTSCAPFTPNQPFSHPWDECQVCICTETASPPYIDVEVNCFTKASCCVEVSEPTQTPYDNKRITTQIPAVTPAPQVIYLEPKCKSQAPHVKYRDQCQICFCTTVYNYVVSKCEPIPGCGQSAPTYPPTFPTIPSTHPTMKPIYPSIYPYAPTGHPSLPVVPTSQSQSYYPSLQTLDPSVQTVYPSSQNVPSSQTIYPSPQSYTGQHSSKSYSPSVQPWHSSSQNGQYSSQAHASSMLTTYPTMHPISYSTRTSSPAVHSVSTSLHPSIGTSTTLGHGSHKGGSVKPLNHGGKHAHGRQKNEDRVTSDLDRTVLFQTQPTNNNQNQIQDLLSLLNQGQSDPSYLNNKETVYLGQYNDLQNGGSSYSQGPGAQNDFMVYNTYPAGYTPTNAITSTFNTPNDAGNYFYPSRSVSDYQSPAMYDQGYDQYQEPSNGFQNVAISEAQALVNALGQISQDQVSPNINSQPGYLQTPQMYGLQGYNSNEAIQQDLEVIPLADFRADEIEDKPTSDPNPKFQIKSGKPDSGEVN